MNGGEISYVATIDTKQLKSQLKDGEKSLLGFNDVAEKAGETLDNMIDGDILKNLKSMGIEVGKTGAELKKALKDADNFVSGMETGLKVVVAEHAKLLAEINKMPEGNARNQLLEEYRNEAVEIEKVSNQITQYKEFLSNVKDESKSLTVKLKEVTDEMKVLYDRGEQNSARYQELKEKAVEYKEALSVVNNEIKIASGPQGFNGLINLLTFSAGAFSTVQGAVGLFGTESEDLNKIMLRVQSSLALVIGLQEIQKQLSKEGAFNITVLSRAKEIWAAMNLRVATTLGISTVAAQALTATLTLGLSVAIVGVIALLDKSSGKLKEQSELNKKISDSLAEPIIAYKNLQTQWNSLGSDLDKKKKFITDNQKAFEDLGFSVNNVTDAENFFVNKTSDVIQAMTLRAKAAASMEIATEQYKKALQAQMDYENESKIMNKGFFGAIKDGQFSDRLAIVTKRFMEDKSLIKQQNEANQKANDALNNAFNFNQQYDALFGNGLNKFSSTKNKTEKIKNAKDAAEAQKAIEIKTLTDQINESKRLWEQYYNAVNSIGKQKADELYADLLKKDKSLFDALVRQRDSLLKKGNLNDEEKTVLDALNNDIDALLGQKSQLDQFKEKTEKTLSNLSTISEKIAYLDSLKNAETNTQTSLGIGAYLTEESEKYRNEQKQRYQEFLAAHQSFEEKRLEISKSYAELRQKIELDPKLDNEQRKNALEKAGQEEADAYSDAFMNELVNNPQYREAFTDLERQTTAKLLELRNQLQNSLSNNKNLNPEAQAKIRKDIQELNSLIGSKNPYILIKDAIKSFGNESLSAKDKLEILSNAIAATNKYLDLFENIVNSVENTLSELGVSSDNLFGDILNNVKNTISGIKESLKGVEDLKSSYNDYLEAKDADDTLGKLTAGFGMLSAGIKIVSGAIKAVSGWLSGDNKKERQIKAWANEVNNLKLAYEELERAVSKALGEDKYKAQQTVINNLKEQKRLLEQMMQKEIDKKKTDQGKVNDYKSQIASINAQIEDIQNNIIKNILQTDAQSAAAKLGDALVEAFSKGEDGAKAMRDVANDMFKDIVKNALNMKLEKAMQPILNDMLKAIGYNEDGTGSFVGLSSSQMEEFRQRIADAGKFGQDFINQYAELFQGLDSSTNGLKGDIKGVSEKTAGALESQINAIRIYQVEALNISKRNQQIFLDSLRHQAEIASNTRSLLPMKTILEDILTKLKKL